MPLDVVFGGDCGWSFCSCGWCDLILSSIIGWIQNSVNIVKNVNDFILINVRWWKWSGWWCFGWSCWWRCRTVTHFTFSVIVSSVWWFGGWIGFVFWAVRAKGGQFNLHSSGSVTRWARTVIVSFLRIIIVIIIEISVEIFTSRACCSTGPTSITCYSWTKDGRSKSSDNFRNYNIGLVIDLL